MSYWAEWSDADIERCAVAGCEHMRGDHSHFSPGRCLQSHCPCEQFLAAVGGEQP